MPREANVSKRQRELTAKCCKMSSKMRTSMSPLGLCHGWSLLPGWELCRLRDRSEVRNEWEVRKRSQRV